MSLSALRNEAAALDAADPLAGFRERFVIDDSALIYLDGNSLGRLPKAAAQRARRLVEQEWGAGLIGGWNASWWDMSQRLGGKLAQLLGAGADEVILADSTSINLFKLALAALRAAPDGRRHVVTDALNFPSDRYILQSALELAGRGGRLITVASEDGISVPPSTLVQALDSETALLSLSHTAFKSAYVHPLAEVTDLAHRHGALMLWDFSHSVGAMPLDLSAANVDLAAGCCYKYLNGGPGAPAFLYARRELQERLLNPMCGWFGHEEPFRFDADYRPAAGLRRFLTGTPPILSMALIEPGVDLLLEAGMQAVRAKSVEQTAFLIQALDTHAAPLGFTVASPRHPDSRGSHVSVTHAEGGRISQALVDRGVIPDFRPPHHIRLGVCPLYTTFSELARAVETLVDCGRPEVYGRYAADPGGVT